MKRIMGVSALATLMIGVFPSQAEAGNLDFSRTTCDQGVSVAWIADAGLHTTPQDPPVDVWSMVVDGLFINGEPADFRAVDAVTIQADPLTASGNVEIEIVLHWHADRPDGTSYDSPPLRRTGTVSCSSSLMPSRPPRDPDPRSESAAPTTTNTEVISRAGDLPVSGTTSGPVLAAGFGLVVFGLAVRRIGQRRRALHTG